MCSSAIKTILAGKKNLYSSRFRSYHTKYLVEIGSNTLKVICMLNADKRLVLITNYRSMNYFQLAICRWILCAEIKLSQSIGENRAVDSYANTKMT